MEEEEEKKCYHGGTNNKRKRKDRLGYSANESLKAKMHNREFCLLLGREVFSLGVEFLPSFDFCSDCCENSGMWVFSEVCKV